MGLWRNIYIHIMCYYVYTLHSTCMYILTVPSVVSFTTDDGVFPSLASVVGDVCINL